MTIWEDEKLELADIMDYQCKFFARVKNASKADIDAAFGKVSYVELSDVNDEVAFVTEKISERDFQNKIKDLDLIYRIRTTM